MSAETAKDIIAHKREDGAVQSLKEHLDGVALLAERFAIDGLKEVARCAGANHDVGKCRPDFQRRIRGENVQCEHACCAAQEIFSISERKDYLTCLLAYCMAGHHAGLQDGGTPGDTENDATLQAALKREVGDYLPEGRQYSKPCPPSPYLEATLKEAFQATDRKSGRNEFFERFAFFTRYVYSCLVDADFLDTEAFCLQEGRPELVGDYREALRLLDEKLAKFVPDTDVKQARATLQQQAVSNVGDEEISFLNMPTGSGKTLCSVKIALEQAIKTGKKRIVYVIPYTAIIEQTAEVFDGIFQDSLPILQHHSNYDLPEGTEDEDTIQKILRASENWDAPFVITTNVQFFQSLYHHKSSRLRKLHNLADAVIVFDEIHMMPVPYVQPCLRAIGYVTKYLNSQAIFLSATMPDFTDLIRRYTPGCRHRDLLPDKTSFPAFENRRYAFIGQLTDEAILERIGEHQSCLVVVNRRRHAQELYRKIGAGCHAFHLSTYRTARDRSAAIREIREKLEEIRENPAGNKRVVVISTSLIETGVDLDFETVYRELAGLDNVIQAGGRCNREGKRPQGDVFVFESEGCAGNSALSVKGNVCKSILTEYENAASPEAIADYYRRIFAFNRDVINANSIATGSTDLSSVRFRTYSESFDLIESDTIHIVVPTPQNEQLIHDIPYGGMRIKRQLQRDCVSVYPYEFRQLVERGLASDYGTGIYRLTDHRYYDPEIGLNPQYEPVNIV